MMARPEVMLGTDGPLCIRQMHFKSVGDEEPKHTHSFGHWTHLSHGRASFLRKGGYEEHRAPTILWIEPDDPHHIIALEPDTVACCITDQRDPNVIRML